MNCREYIIEFEERGDLSEPARLHLTVCAECQKASAAQTQIWLLIEDFKPIAAPTDFDFHVKAKIANAKPSDFQKPSFVPILRYVLPLSVAVLLLGIFVFNSSYFSNAPTASPVAKKEDSSPAIPGNSPMTVSAANQLAFVPPANADKTVVASAVDEKSSIPPSVLNQTKNTRNTRIETAEANPNKSPNAGKNDDAGGGSHDIAVTKTTPILPFGFNLNSNTDAAPKIENLKPADEKESLSIIGIEFVLKSGSRTVISVQENSIAARSGVKIGDVIEQIKGNNLTVRRGTEKLEITLQNNVNQPR